MPHVSRLNPKELQIWQFRFSNHYAQIDALLPLLSGDERERSDRFHRKRDYLNYTIVRALLRVVLSHYLNQRPEEIHFEYSAYGKPSIKNQRDLHFNLSHSSDFLLIALSSDSELGIDIEYIEPQEMSESVLKRVFSPSELEDFNLLKVSERLLLFFQTWARKEAYLKGIDKGLTVSPSELQIVYNTDQERRFIDQENDRDAAERWTLYDLDVAPEYAAAIAVEGRNHKIHLFTLPEGQSLHSGS